MAENKGLFGRLRQLFSGQIIIRKTDDNRVVVKDLNLSQQSLTSNFIDRYSRIMHGSKHMSWAGSTSSQNRQAAFEVARNELFRDYEMMDSDPILSSALNVYADECTIDNIEGEILKIKTENPKIHEILHNLFYDVINIEFNLWSWIRNLTKYGDFYLQLDILDKYGIVGVRPLSAYDVNRLEEHDPENPNLVQFEILGEEGLRAKKTIKDSYEIAHFRLLSDANFVPYGKSMIEGARRVFKQLQLMEDAMLIHRIMRAPEKRIFKVDVGNLPPNEVENFMQKIISKMKRTPVIDQDTGDYNLRYNLESTTEDYFMPVRGGDSGTEIETLPGLSNDNAIEDIEYLRNKLMAALRIPKAFLGYEEEVNAKATLAAEDVRFARTIERLQKIAVSELTKVAIVHLYTQGFDNAELLNFDLELTNPSMIHEQEKLELLEKQLDIANTAMENKLLSREWIYDNIFNMNQQEKIDIFTGIIEDKKQEFRMTQIEGEGSDPAETGKEANNDENEVGEPDNWGGDRRSGTGKTEYTTAFDKEDHENIKSKDYKGVTGGRKFKRGGPLGVNKGSTIVKSEGFLEQLKKEYGEINASVLITEENNK